MVAAALQDIVGLCGSQGFAEGLGVFGIGVAVIDKEALIFNTSGDRAKLEKRIAHLF